MEKEDTSITGLIEGMKDLADEILDKGEKLVEKYTPDCGYGERELSDGRIKNTTTGIVTEPVTRDLDDADRQVPKSNGGF